MEIYCRYCKKLIKSPQNGGVARHENFCKCNPNAKVYVGHKSSPETRKKISESMKKAHTEGRAHNIGDCRWHNKPSYPEQWFMNMLEKELGQVCDKDFFREVPFHRFSLDFVWPNQKLVVELDGDQHERFQEQKQRDIEKDRLLKEEGWKELRISWQVICNNTKSFIEEFKKFFENGETSNIDIMANNFFFERKAKILEREKLIESGKVNSLGHVCKTKLIESEYIERKELIENSGVDLKKFGWVSKVSKKTGLSKHQIENCVKHFNLDVFKRT